MKTLVQFAGDDQMPRIYRGRRPTALSLFRLGRDTAEIAQVLDLPEPLILKRINIERSDLLSLPNPYKA